MLISGIQKLSLLDFPDTPACIVFKLGCNFRCGLCHNPEFVRTEEVRKIRKACIPEENIFEFLTQRKGFIEGVVITGGEPTIQHDLIPFIREIRNRGFKVKLDSNGSRPEILRKVIEEMLVDYIAMDMKISLDRYKEITPRCVAPEKIRESIRLLIESKIPYEFRSTLIKELHDDKTLKHMSQEIKGAKKIYFQEFRPARTLDPMYGHLTPFTQEEMKTIAHKIFASCVEEAHVRT